MQVKICGVTRARDAAAAARLGADAVGLNFYPASPRCVSVERAREIVGVLPDSVKAVAVLVAGQGGAEALLRALREEVGLTRLQVHGQGVSGFLRGLTPPVAPDDAWSRVAAFSVAARQDLDIIVAEVRACGVVSAALIDAKVAGLHGGTGRTAPWDLLAGFDPGAPLVLAGGLTPENVAAAIARVSPWGVDVAGGVESAPGLKDEEKMRRFIAAAREAGGNAGAT